MFLSLITILLILNATLFNFNYHNESFYKFDLHSHIENIMIDAKEDFLTLIGGNLTKNEKQILASTLESALTTENIRSHVDITLYELISYIKDDTPNPPNIYIADNLPDTLDPLISKSIPSTISSTTLLSYFNKDQIIFSSLALKFFYFSANILLIFSISIIILLASLLIIFNQKTKDLLVKIFTSILTCSFLNLVFILILIFFIPKRLDLFLNPSSIGYFFIPDVLSSYFSNLINTITIYLSISTAITIALAIFLKFISNKTKNTYKIQKPKIFAFVLITIFLIATILKVEHISNKNLENNYSNTFRNLILNTASETVISAGDDSAYNILLNVVNNKDLSAPLPDIPFEITGISKTTKESITLTGVTDEDGNFSNPIYQGSYRITFDKDYLPEKFLTPRPYYFSIENPGTFVLRISLVERQEDPQSSGHLEIIVLGDENIPLENIQLKLNKSDNLQDELIPQQKEFSVTNNQGIAIFQSDIGKHEVSLVEQTLPENYQLKEPFNVEILENTISTYTIKLISSND